MKIQELFNNDPDFKLFRLLGVNDNEKIINFFNQTSMQTTDLKLRYERLPNFFTFLNFQSDKSFVVGADKNEEEIKLTASFTVRDGYINGHIKRIAYLGDLRVKGGISFSKKWQNAYGKLLEKSSELEDAGFDYAITAIMGGNKKALSALVNNPRSQFHYNKICDYYMVNLIMPYWKITKIKKEVYRATEKDKKDLLNFLETQNKNKLFGYSRAFIERALDVWPDFSISNFIIVKDNDQIVGATATWNPGVAKKIVVESLPSNLKILNKLISPFTKTTKVNDELKVQYLNFLNVVDSKNIDKQLVLLKILEFLRQENAFRKFDLISFGDFSPNYLHKGLKNLITDKTSLELYQVVHKNNKTDIISPNNDDISFEISLV